MPLRPEKVVIDGVIVTRYNGNSSSSGRGGTRQARDSRRLEETLKIQTAWQKSKARKRVGEAAYKRRYLGGS